MSSKQRHRAGLSPAVIAEAGLAIVRAGGTEALTMRALADRLGVQAPSLYNHVPSRDALLTLVSQSAIAAAAEPFDFWAGVTTIDEWNAATIRASNWIRGFYAAHRGLALHNHRSRLEAYAEDMAAPGLRHDEIGSLQRLGLDWAQAEWVSRVHSAWALAFLALVEQDDHEHADTQALWDAGLQVLAVGLKQHVERLLAEGPAQPRPGRVGTQDAGPRES